MRKIVVNTAISTSCVNGHKVIMFHLIWTKSTGIHGGECILTATNDLLCPVWALENHFHINNISDHDAPLSAFGKGSTWLHLSKDQFLKIPSGIYNSSHLDIVLGHSYHIGGSVHLLTMGMAPEIIMKLGGWTSMCFLLYWHHLELIVPLAITHAWVSQQRAFVKNFNIANASFDSSFDTSFNLTI
ncbi:hypothetical protein L208DRAFT_1379597 [Tricholoma matsutake]|nr:hypothetical protein L208DRAFT_1379597 [Tricholoma matsutake 945]